MVSTIISRIITKSFRYIGRKVATSPGYFILFPVFICAILSTSLPSATFISNPDYLYTVIGSSSKLDREFIERTFPQNVVNDFDLRRSTRYPRGVWLIITAPEETTVLKKYIFKEAAAVDKLIQKVFIRWSKRKWKYETLCAKKNKKCYNNPILSLLPRMKAIEEGKRRLRYPIDSESIITGPHLGGVTTNSKGYIANAKAILLSYYLNDTDARHEQRARMWEEEVMKTLAMKSFHNITVTRISSSSFEEQLHGVIMNVLKLCIPLVVTMVLLAVLTSTTSNCTQSMPLCAALGCLSSGLAVVSAFGIIIYTYGQLSDVCLSVPFLTLGVGMDDTFVMLAAWRRTDPKKTVEERLGETYEESAVSITITSLTNFVTFCVGLASSYHAIRLFCLYAVVSVLFTYIYQATFFGACLALNAYFDCYCVVEVDKRIQRNENNYITKNLKRDHFIALLFRDKFAPCLTVKKVKLGILVLHFIYLGFAIWGCTKLQKSIDNTTCLPKHSYVTDFYNDYNQYFPRYRETIQVIINKPVNYADVRTQNEIEQLLKNLESSQYVADSSLTESWLRAYLLFLRFSRHILHFQGYDIYQKEDFIKVLRSTFLPMPEASQFSKDIVFDLNHTEILCSRFLLQSDVTGTSDKDGKMVEEIRQLTTSSSNVPSFAFGPGFVNHEQYLTVDKATLRTVCVTAIVVMFVFFLFMPDVSCVLSVGLLIISIEVGAVGFMSFWDVKLDALCMLNLMLCIGYSIDYAAHMTHFYINSNEETVKGRIRHSMYSAGLPIIQCSISTLAGVLVLAFAPAQIFLTFVKLVVLVIVLSTAHSLFVLPLLLSARDCKKETPSKETNVANC